MFHFLQGLLPIAVGNSNPSLAACPLQAARMATAEVMNAAASPEGISVFAILLG